MIIIGKILEFSILELAAGIIAIVGAFFASHKLIMFTFKWGIKTLEHLSGVTDLRGQIGAVSTKLDKVLSEFQPNGGKNTTDKLNEVLFNQSRADARFRAMQADSHTCVFETDPYGGIIDVNTKLNRLTGRTTEELIGYGWYGIIDPEEREEIAEQWEICLKEKKSLEVEFTLVTVNNEKLKVKLNLRRMGPSTGPTFGYYGSIHQVNNL